MNTNRHKFSNKQDGIVRLCSKHCKTLVKSTSKTSKSRIHTPSVRCHEEVMCKMVSTDSKPEEFTCELDGPCYKDDLKNIKKSKSKEQIKKSSKSPNSKPKMYYESSSEKINTCGKDLLNQSLKSKSAPVVQKPNLEDSVDFIPVKLSNRTNSCKWRPEKQEPKSVSSDKLNKNRGPTWDQLLKGDSESVFQNNIKNQIANGNVKNHHLPHYLPDTSKKKVYHSDSKKANLKYDNMSPTYKICNSPKSNGTLSNKLHMSDPIKTLDILIEKLREQILKQPQNDNLNKIILDMENALLKISLEDQPKTMESEICSSVKSSTDITSKSPQSDTKQSNIGELDIHSLKKNLEESCLFLQSLCIKQRESCSNHIREKEQLSIQLAESRRLLAIAKSREKDYEKAMGELRLKIQEAKSKKEQQSQSLEELTDKVAKLKAENEVLGSLNVRFKECSAEKEILQSKVYLKDLEIEKLKVLLEVKQNLNSASNNYKNKKFEGGNIEDELRLDIPKDDKDNILSLSSESSLTLCKPRIICSSQASSSPRRSPSPYDSWQHISSIPQDLTEINELRNSMVRVFNIMKTDSEWSDSFKLDLEEPLVPSSFSEEEEEIKLKEVKLGCDSIETLSS